MIDRDELITDATTLRRWLSYDPSNGVFTWLQKPAKYIAAGSQAGAVNACGYVSITLHKRPYLAHRLAWLYMTGKFPSDCVDHINGMRSDNRWRNLREANHALNQQNKRGANSNSKTGVLGVSRSGRGYRAALGVNGRNYYSRTFATVEEASAAYIAMKRQLHPGCVL